jgi:ADP-heptose:LPS heptosyltransferase
VSRVLVARLDNAGDVVLAGPAVRAVAARTGPVAFLCGARGRAAAELLPGVGEVIEWTAPWIDPDPDPVSTVDVLALAGLIRRRFAAAIVLTSFHQSALPLALLLRMAEVPFVAAYSEDYPGSLLDVRARPDDGVHEVKRSLDLVRRAGYPPPDGDDGRLRLRRTGCPPPGLAPPYVVVHPGASVPARTWRPRRWAELVALLAARGRRVVVTGGPGERPLTAEVAGSDAFDLGGSTDLAGLAEVLAAADVVVTGNTGPAHVAAAVGTPVVSLFAPTVPAHRWHPWGVPFVILGDQDIACAGCRARECPVPGHPCVESVPADAVADAVEALTARPIEEAV